MRGLAEPALISDLTRKKSTKIHAVQQYQNRNVIEPKSTKKLLTMSSTNQTLDERFSDYCVCLGKCSGTSITDKIVKESARIFSRHNGVWGLVVAEKTGVKEGSRVKRSQGHLKTVLLPDLEGRGGKAYVWIFGSGYQVGGTCLRLEMDYS